MTPKAFISYSWTSPGHQARIRQWAEQMVNDGVDVVLDIWNLKEGDDKYAFMESMVRDDSVTHVLVFSDSKYAEKADARKAGVGTESQIISSEIYKRIQQSKFVAIVCELDETGEPYLPIFLKSRKWIDFSSLEAVNENWEQLIRFLHGRPAFEKPTIGKPPAYITTETTAPSSPVVTKFISFRQALIQGKMGLKLYRKDFLDSCYEFVDALRVRDRPDIANMGERVLEDSGKLKRVRDHLIDWILFESETKSSEEFGEAVLTLLEQLLELKSRPSEITQWNEAWFEAHRVFVYETFLYIIAALLKTNNFELLNQIFTTHYLLPDTHRAAPERFGNFGEFYGYSETLQILAKPGERLYAPAAELIKRQADRKDLPFESIMEADILALMMAFIAENTYWYPQTLHYSSRYAAFPFFLRATQHRNFIKLAKITGIQNADDLRIAVKAGHDRLQVNNWHNFMFIDRTFWTSMNMESLDSMK